MIRTQISLTEEQAEGLRRLSALRRRSQASLLREALEQVVAQDAQLRRIARARSCIGAYRSGDRSGSVDHDHHLVEAYGS
jgi:uncharacterized protein YfaA (DUF2138 family)